MKSLRKRQIAKQFGIRIQNDLRENRTRFHSRTNKLSVYYINDPTFLNVVKNESRWYHPSWHAHRHPPENPERQLLKTYVGKAIDYAVAHKLKVVVVPGVYPVDIYDLDSILSMLNGIGWDGWKDPAFDPSTLHA